MFFEKPLADLIRPKNLNEFVGQEHLVGKNGPIKQAVEKGNLYSIILWGPPGCGKTTLARVVAKEIKAEFIEISAVSSGVGEVRKIVEKAKEKRKENGDKTILFIDELHRFSKSQQDFLLPYVENGTITLIGATTENPSFEVISPLLSRCRVYILNPLGEEDLNKIIQNALTFLTSQNIALLVKDDAQNLLVQLSNGDSRIALNVLDELASTGIKKVGKKEIENIFQKSFLIYDKGGEEHYNTISAFIKSLRGSSPDAALYYLARMLAGGEDPIFIARRLVILASEDIGLANNNALLLANATFDACHKVGLPECEINLAHCVVYLAQCNKSNRSYMSYLKAKEDVVAFGNLPIPLKLRNPVTKLMKGLDYGKGYKYAHDFTKEELKNETYLPEKIKNKKYL